jgi:hypothetical protein
VDSLAAVAAEPVADPVGKFADRAVAYVSSRGDLYPRQAAPLHRVGKRLSVIAGAEYTARPPMPLNEARRFAFHARPAALALDDQRRRESATAVA